MANRANDAVKRVNSIDWDKLYYSDKKSDFVLAKEYIRRAALFMLEISQDSRNALFRAADIYGRESIVELDILCPNLEGRGIYIRGWCKYYIEWAALGDKGNTLAIQFENLYDPIIKLYERGVILKMHHGCFEVGNNFINLCSGISSYASKIPFDISDDAFDNYDNQ